MFNGLKGHDYPLALYQIYGVAIFSARIKVWLHTPDDKNDLYHKSMSAEVTAAAQFQEQCLDVTRTLIMFLT